MSLNIRPVFACLTLFKNAEKIEDQSVNPLNKSLLVFRIFNRDVTVGQLRGKDILCRALLHIVHDNGLQQQTMREHLASCCSRENSVASDSGGLYYLLFMLFAYI